MARYVIDTNVPVVANGRALDGRNVTVNCRIAAVEFLTRVCDSGVIVLDIGGEIEEEYRRHLNARGQPGVGDLFYQTVINSKPGVVRRIALAKNDDDVFENLPDAVFASEFDLSDRKFVAAAVCDAATVVTCVDGDWVEHSDLMTESGVRVRYLCGRQPDSWFDD